MASAALKIEYDVSASKVRLDLEISERAYWALMLLLLNQEYSLLHHGVQSCKAYYRIN